MNIYVASLSYNTTSDSLKELFENFGEVTSANVIMDRESGRSRGFGFVEMPDESEAKKAIAELDKSELDGRSIAVNEARQREERSSRRY